MVQHLLSFNLSLQSRVILLFADWAIEKVLVPHGTRSQDIHIVDLTDAVKDVVPWLAQEVSIIGSKLKQFSNALKVLLFNFSKRSIPWDDYLGEFLKRWNEGISFCVHLVETRDFDGMHEAFDAEICDLVIIWFLQKDAEDRQIRAPSVLKHWPNGLCIID